jgi:hypothetical protein
MSKELFDTKDIIKVIKDNQHSDLIVLVLKLDNEEVDATFCKKWSIDDLTVINAIIGTLNEKIKDMRKKELLR